MPWGGVTVSEQRQRILEDYQLDYYSVTELAERFGVSRTAAYRWINRFKKHGQAGFHEHSRRPHGCPAASGRIMGCRLPPTPWRGSLSCRCGSPSWGSTPSCRTSRDFGGDRAGKAAAEWGAIVDAPHAACPDGLSREAGGHDPTG